MRRFFVGFDVPLAEGEVSVPHDVAHHISRVLRMKEGDACVLVNGDGRDYQAVLLTVSKKNVVVNVLGYSSPENESPLNITLWQCIAKGDRMETSLQKATELGVTAFQPVYSQYGVAPFKGEQLQKKQDHWQGVVVSACEQSGRARVPKVANAIRFMDAVRQPLTGSKLILDWHDAKALPSMAKAEEYHLLVGPEGGFSPEELAAASEHGWQTTGLGPRILRTETAGPAAIAVLQALHGDWG